MYRKLFLIVYIFFIFINLCYSIDLIDLIHQTRENLLKRVKKNTEYIKKDSKNEDLYVSRGRIYTDLKEYDKALADFNKALKINKKFGKAYIAKYHLYMELQKYKEALDAINKGIKYSRFFAEHILYRAQAFDNLGRYKEALKDYEAFLKTGYRGFLTQETYMLARTRSATLYLYFGQSKKGLDEINIIIKEMPKFKYPYYIRGKAYYALKEYSKSLDDFDKFMDAGEIKKSGQLNSEKNMVYVIRAFIYAEKNDKGDIEYNLKEAFKNGFNDDELLFTSESLLKIMGKDKILMLKDKYYKKP